MKRIALVSHIDLPLSGYSDAPKFKVKVKSQVCVQCAWASVSYGHTSS